ncbi:MAG: hypothetical protein RLN88_11340 [Ekhidna sp.]|uniref:hypothetical protein n=1 Tax=Ekhidna sp. TaxID=2608089 RepID=UPI0032EBA665
MKAISLLTTLCLFTFCAFSQEDEASVVKAVDDLTIKWDAEAEMLQTYEGLGNFCGESQYRKKIIDMLDEIHHYDTLLYGIVTRKFAANEDAEAKLTLDDIQTLESEYTTKAFRRFIHQECNTYNDIEKNLGAAGGKEYKQEVKALETELKKYVIEVTKQIDLIDEHVHHLHLGED